MRYVTTNTVKAADPNAKFKALLTETKDARGRVTVHSKIPLRTASTNTSKMKQFPSGMGSLASPLNAGRRPAEGFRPLQSADLRAIEDNKKRVTLLAQKKSIEAQARAVALADGATKPKRGRKAK